MALVTRTRPDGRHKSSVVCSHCTRMGHEADTCFALHGYPEWWGDRPRSNGKGAGRGRGQSNARGGGRGTKGMHRANVAQIGSTDSAVIETNASSMPGLNTDRWQTLLQMLGGSKPATIKKMTGKPWIIDTGASNHMTGMIGDLRDLREIAQCSVGLPDGSSAIATKEGTVTLESNLCLKNVLYVPGLTCNLISMSQLTDHYNCFVQFTNGLCVIQHRTSRMLIGVVEI